MSLLTGSCCSYVVVLHPCTILYGFSAHSRVRDNENVSSSPPPTNRRGSTQRYLPSAHTSCPTRLLCTSSFCMARSNAEAAFPLLYAVTCQLDSPQAALHRCRTRRPSCAAFKCSRRVPALRLGEDDINISTVPRVFTQELSGSERRKGRGLYRQGTGEHNADPEQMCAATYSFYFSSATAPFLPFIVAELLAFTAAKHNIFKGVSREGECGRRAR